MHPDVPPDVTRVLNEVDERDRVAVGNLLPVVYADLRRLAARYFQNERSDHTLQPTALVHEALMRLMGDDVNQFQSREHFFRVAAVTMRHILLQHARDRRRLKRGGGRQAVALSDKLAGVGGPDVDLIALDEALTRLTEMDPRQGQIVELRFFGGLTMDEIAEVMGVSKRTAEDDWRLAKAWLWRELNA